MKGKVTKIEDGVDGRKLATVELEGVDGSTLIPYWPELLEQWGEDRLRGWILYQAEQQIAPEPAPAPAEDPHAAVIGEGEAAAVEVERAEDAAQSDRDRATMAQE